MKKVVCIVGPTGSGKTALSIQIAKQFGAEIINADSVQMYKELNIGSAKITSDEMEGIVHHLLDITTLDVPFTIYEFQHMARACINKIEKPLFVGGSGLYLKAALYDYELNAHQKKVIDVPFDEMLTLIRKNDPNFDMANKTERQIESAYQQALSGMVRSEKIGKDRPLYELCLIYLDLDRELLRTRVTTRLEHMMAHGFVSEAQALYQKGYRPEVIGYRQLTDYFSGHITLDEAKQQIINKTMQFAKRQKTWFLNQMNPHILNATAPDLLNQAQDIIKIFLKE